MSCIDPFGRNPNILVRYFLVPTCGSVRRAFISFDNFFLAVALPSAVLNPAFCPFISSKILRTSSGLPDAASSGPYLNSGAGASISCIRLNALPLALRSNL